METQEERIAKLELQVSGKCPECKQYIKDYEPMFGYFAPEWWATKRENGIDPATGHKLNCKNKSLKIK